MQLHHARCARPCGLRLDVGHHLRVDRSSGPGGRPSRKPRDGPLDRRGGARDEPPGTARAARGGGSPLALLARRSRRRGALRPEHRPSARPLPRAARHARRAAALPLRGRPVARTPERDPWLVPSRREERRLARGRQGDVCNSDGAMPAPPPPSLIDCPEHSRLCWLDDHGGEELFAPSTERARDRCRALHGQRDEPRHCRCGVAQ